MPEPTCIMAEITVTRSDNVNVFRGGSSAKFLESHGHEVAALIRDSFAATGPR